MDITTLNKDDYQLHKEDRNSNICMICGEQIAETDQLWRQNKKDSMLNIQDNAILTAIMNPLKGIMLTNQSEPFNDNTYTNESDNAKLKDKYIENVNGFRKKDENEFNAENIINNRKVKTEDLHHIINDKDNFHAINDKDNDSGFESLDINIMENPEKLDFKDNSEDKIVDTVDTYKDHLKGNVLENRLEKFDKDNKFVSPDDYEDKSGMVKNEDKSGTVKIEDKSGSINNSCKHVLCLQCFDDYVLVDPEDKDRQCPFCREEREEILLFK